MSLYPFTERLAQPYFFHVLIRQRGVTVTISAAKPSIPAAAPTVVTAYTRRRKGVIIKDPEEELSSKNLAETPKLKDKGKEAQEAKDLKKPLEVVDDEDDDVFTEATPLARKMDKMLYGKVKEVFMVWHAIGSKWGFRNKLNERGIVVRNKARLVAQRHTREEGIYYDEVFALVSRIEAIRLLLAYALLNDFVVYQMGVKSAFLYGKIKEEVRDLQLEDDDGIDCLLNPSIFENLALMGYEKVSERLTFYKSLFSDQQKFLIHTILQCLSPKTTTWNEFSSTLASEIIFLATNKTSNFSKMIFDGMLRRLDNVSGKFLMYPRFIQTFLDKPLDGLPTHKETYDVSFHTKKVFANMKRIGAWFSDEAVHKYGSDSLVRATTTASSLEADQDSEDELKRTKTAQQTKIDGLERRVKKLEKKQMSRTHKLKRLYKGRIIDDLDVDEDITLVNDQEMFDVVKDLQGEEVVVEQVVVVDKEPIVDVAHVSAATTTITINDITLAKALEALKTSKPKIKRIVIKDHEEKSESRTTTTISSKKSHDNGKAKMIEEPVKLKKKDQILFDEEAKVDADYQLVERLQAEEQQELNEEEKAKLFMELLEKRRKFFAAKRTKGKRNRPPTKAQQRIIITELVKESSKKVEAEITQKESSKRLVKIIPKEDIAIDAIRLAVKTQIVDCKIYKEGKKSYYQIIRAGGKSKNYLVFSYMLKDFNREDVETLWKLVKSKYGSTRPEEDYDRVIWGDLKVMFDPYIEDEDIKTKDFIDAVKENYYCWSSWKRLSGIVSTTSPTLTPFGDSDFLLFEEAKAFLGLEDDPDLPELDPSYYDPEGDIQMLEAFLNSNPAPSLPNNEQSVPSFTNELKACEVKTIKSSVDEPPEVELKDLPPHLEYAFLEGDNKLPVIIANELGEEEKAALIKIHDVIKKEVEKLFNAGLIYPISDNPWVSPVHCVPKKGGFTIVKNEENELIPTRLVTGWRVCIDYRKLNEATRKDHFPIPFIDQMLERLARNEYYCFLDGFSGYFQIPIDPCDQEKTTFTCPYGTFAYRRMPFGLCNAPGTFQRCMLAIFYDMVEKTMEVFMDDFLVFGNSFKTCLSRLDKMLQRCEDTKLCLNWEKSHFMVKEGIVLGHKISRNRIEVDKAKVDVFLAFLVSILGF
nr:reverse transcriptase domain-containing protein [Tanacetum cinerariifolium]